MLAFYTVFAVRKEYRPSCLGYPAFGAFFMLTLLGSSRRFCDGLWRRQRAVAETAWYRSANREVSLSVEEKKVTTAYTKVTKKEMERIRVRSTKERISFFLSSSCLCFVYFVYSVVTVFILV